MLFERDVSSRHDWEHVVTPVVDAVIRRFFDDLDDQLGR